MLNRSIVFCAQSPAPEKQKRESGGDDGSSLLDTVDTALLCRLTPFSLHTDP